MAILKKGSKGGAVEDVQKLLNKRKSRPELVPDGIFGSLTEKSVIYFQKSKGLSPDGKVGSNTYGALKTGKTTAPKMTVIDYSRKLADSQERRKDNFTILEKWKAVGVLGSHLNQDVNLFLPVAVKALEENSKHFQNAANLAKQIADKQKKFEAIKHKDLELAKKLVRECEALDKKVKSIVLGTMGPNRTKAANMVKAIRKKVDSHTKNIENNIKIIDSLLAK